MIWYPYQQMKTMQTPYEIVDAEGVYLYTRERRMIDSVSSWWCNADSRSVSRLPSPSTHFLGG